MKRSLRPEDYLLGGSRTGAETVETGREMATNDEIYYRLARVLDTLPSGWPATESGIEIKILKRIFLPEEADLFCHLRLTPESASQIAKRTGRPLEGLEDKLTSMWQKGQIRRSERAGVSMFKMLPWVIGIYELQLDKLDRELAQMLAEYGKYFGSQFAKHDPPLLQVVPIEEHIPVKQEALICQQVSKLIESAASFMVVECICKKRQGLLDSPCSKPREVCLILDASPRAFDDYPLKGRVVSKEEAFEVLRKAEEAGLVHLTNNLAESSEHTYICNCCGCCCSALRAINMGVPKHVNSHYYAEIDPDKCSGCGICADERCQVRAIEKREAFYSVIKEKCIGCGLCASTCPGAAVKLIHKEPEERADPTREPDGVV